MSKKFQKRTICTISGLHLREAAEGEASRTIEGYALKFGVRSLLLCDWWAGRYYEVLEKGCVTREMLDAQKIVLTMYHNNQIILGRSNNGEGTLSYEVDDVGVKFVCEMPRTAHGDEALELVQRGDIDGCSFCYSTDEDDSENAVSYEKTKDEETGEDVLLRHVKRIDNVYDFTLTPNPAYVQTEVSKREVDDYFSREAEESDEKPEEEDVTDELPDEGDGVDADGEELTDEEKEEKRELLKSIRNIINREY